MKTKQQVWEAIYPKVKHLENYCTIKVEGIEEDTKYFHPKFIVNDEFYITSQCDVGNNHMYAMRAVLGDISIDIDEALLNNTVIGYHTNKESVLLALNTLVKVKAHINNLQYYTTDYINNVLLGTSINDVTDMFINELKATNQIITFMQNNVK